MPTDPTPSDRINLFEVWKEYQHVAMHFNDLLMRLRSQSLAAVGALVSIAGFAFRGDVAAATRWNALFAAFAALCVFWVACRSSLLPVERDTLFLLMILQVTA